MNDEVGGDVNEFLKRHTLGMAAEKGIEFLTNWKVTGVDSGKVRAQTLLGEQELECDTVVVACGFTPRRAEVQDLERMFGQQGAEVRVVGSALEAGMIFEATQSGFWTAVEI